MNKLDAFGATALSRPDGRTTAGDRLPEHNEPQDDNAQEYNVALSANALRVLEKRYLAKDEAGDRKSVV